MGYVAVGLGLGLGLYRVTVGLPRRQQRVVVTRSLYRVTKELWVWAVVCGAPVSVPSMCCTGRLPSRLARKTRSRRQFASQQVAQRRCGGRRAGQSTRMFG